MASSSRKSCFQCEDSSSDQFRNGWRIRSGELAQLCRRCAIVYNEGRFCETFHSSDDGWRDCESCGKMVHCGCIVSFNTYLLLDFGGVICMECTKINFIRARNRCLSFENQIGVGKQLDISRRIQIEPCYWPRVTELELQRISRKPKSAVVPLFEKLLVDSDADLNLARLMIPNKCAEAFFPAIVDPHGLPIKILDTEGKEWEFQFRYWLNCGSKVYALEGLRDYMILKKWKAGHIVTFYRMEPDKRLIMGLRRTSSGALPHEQARMFGNASSTPNP